MSLSCEPKKEDKHLEREVIYSGSVKIKANTGHFPNAVAGIWMKRSERIDLGQEKYRGTVNVIDPVLCINNVCKSDEDIYMCKIIANDDKRHFSEKLKIKVIGGKNLFSIRN